MPILGSDFLRHNHLVVDVAGSRLLHSWNLYLLFHLAHANSSSDLYTPLRSQDQRWNLKNLSRGLNLPKPGLN